MKLEAILSNKRYTRSNIDSKINDLENEIKESLKDAFLDIKSAEDISFNFQRLSVLKTAQTIMCSNLSYAAYEDESKPDTFDNWRMKNMI